MISQIGTHASAILVRDLIMSHRVNAYDATLMLGNLPMNIHSPTIELLDEMEKMTKPHAKILEPIHERTILCFATMIYRTFKYESNPGTNATLQNYLKNFYEQLISKIIIIFCFCYFINSILIKNDKDTTIINDPLIYFRR